MKMLYAQTESPHHIAMGNKNDLEPSTAIPQLRQHAIYSQARICNGFPTISFCSEGS